MFVLTFVIFLLTFLTFVYAYKISFFFFGLFRIKEGKNPHLHPATILIPARNEEQNIRNCLDCLVNQNYPENKLQIIVIDDNSTDRTAEVVRSYFQKYPFIHLINLDQCPPGISPKKRALQAGIEAAEHEIIFTIDADCQAPVNWIKTMMQHFTDKVGLVAGYVFFNRQHEKNLFQKIVSLEFIGLTTAGIGSIGAGDPIIANGANLAFRKRAFYDAQGYQNESHIISGDDDLLVQNIDTKTNWQIRAAINLDAVVQTAPPATFIDFMNQRVRWASKGLIYKKLSLVFFLIMVYLFYLMLFISLPFALTYPASFPYPLFAFAIKLIVDFLLILKGTAILNRKDLRKYFLPAEIFQLPYIIYVGFAGILGTFEWKGR